MCVLLDPFEASDRNLFPWWYDFVFPQQLSIKQMLILISSNIIFNCCRNVMMYRMDFLMLFALSFKLKTADAQFIVKYSFL